MKNYAQKGNSLDYLNSTGALIPSGSPVVVGNQIGVAATDIAVGETGTVYMEEVFGLPKTAGASTAMIQGSTPVFDISAGAFVPEGTATATGDVTGAVTCWEAAADADDMVYVKLNTGKGSIAA
ncbi:hypothetical protein TH9_12225 [Thalassospira xiamenensis]|uniref:DUF2190 family protein n=1 Tax=Thalassospira xiamenensis TaxID=220697 RepID=UPI000DED3CAB|nr:DUF2190 family protein [Thalassospira xiamenensis]RCK32492.1 hypothetical protein TH9_12225 [Thalassospira xiamenensis]